MGLLGRLGSAIGRAIGLSAIESTEVKTPIETPQGIGGAQTVGSFLTSAEKNAKLASVQRRVATYQDLEYNVSIVATSVRYVNALITATAWNVHPPRPKALLNDKSQPTGDKSETPIPAKQAADNPDTDRDGDGDSDLVDLTPAETKLAAQYASAIRQNLKRMQTPWYKAVRNAASFKWIGFSVQEMLAQRMDDVMPGYIGIGAIENRPQHTFEQWNVDPTSGEVESWIQRGPNDGEQYPLDRERCIYLCDDTISSQPDGVGLLRHVVQLCEQLRELEKLEIWAYQTDLRGVPIGYAPTAVLDDMVKKNRMTVADKDKLLAGITDFIQHHVLNPELGLLLDSSPYTSSDAARTPVGNTRMWGLELVKGSGTGLAEIAVSIERKQHEIARVLCTEQFMLGAGGKGSLALSEDKARALIELINSIIMEVAWCLEHDFVRRIFILNKWDMKLMPRLLPDAVALRSVTVIVDALSKLALAGATVDRNDPVINQIRNMLKLVEQPFVTPEMIAATKPPNAGGTPGDKGPNSPNEGKDSKVTQGIASELERRFAERLKSDEPVTPLEMMNMFVAVVNERKAA